MAKKSNPLPFDPPIHILTEKTRYPPVGRCIYCGTYSNKLEIEHVIPFGIAGNAMLLPKASCRACASITGQIEQACLRHLWWPFRTRIGTPTGSKRPETFKLRRVTADERRLIAGKPVVIGTSDIDAKDYPLNYLALLLPLPGILAGRAPTEMFEGRFWTCFSAEEMQRYLGSDEAMLMGPINPNTFARMLAKIAYAYLVGAQGYGKFKPLVLDLIMGRSTTANYWVGGDLELPPPSANPLIHDMRIRRCTVNRQNAYTVVTIQLFAFLRSPLYHVVVAEAD